MSRTTSRTRIQRPDGASLAREKLSALIERDARDTLADVIGGGRGGEGDGAEDGGENGEDGCGVHFE